MSHPDVERYRELDAEPVDPEDQSDDEDDSR